MRLWVWSADRQIKVSSLLGPTLYNVKSWCFHKATCILLQIFRIVATSLVPALALEIRPNSGLWDYTSTRNQAKWLHDNRNQYLSINFDQSRLLALESTVDLNVLRIQSISSYILITIFRSRYTQVEVPSPNSSPEYIPGVTFSIKLYNCTAVELRNSVNLMPPCMY